MAITPLTLLFFDASCLFAAASSSTGGSAFLLSVCRRGFLRACSGQPVLIETERNIRDKRPPSILDAYHLLLAETSIALVELPPPERVRHYEPVFFEDAHVVASAVAAGADALITLDKRLARRVQDGSYPLLALSPKDFIEQLLPTHPAFSSIR